MFIAVYDNLMNGYKDHSSIFNKESNSQFVCSMLYHNLQMHTMGTRPLVVLSSKDQYVYTEVYQISKKYILFFIDYYNHPESTAIQVYYLPRKRMLPVLLFYCNNIEIAKSYPVISGGNWKDNAYILSDKNVLIKAC